ncbi:MAG: tRNA pseudouridine(55) synthase TruB [Oscillospiraceae bacterium]|nr:tRNA pseudouridine(55) synthase TruB [Oscillospiraceae bacterium]
MNGIICINKPKDHTSFDIVAIMRRLFKTKKVGHGGTLDPMAEGVLPIFIGGATKAADFQPCQDKEYRAGFKLGITTDTQDITGRVISESKLSVPIEKLSVAAQCYIGETEQIPPMYSAVQVNGVRLYDLARKGKEIERKPKKININNLEIEEYRENEGIMRISCSKGTYIRTIIHDIGQDLGTGGVMTRLTRTKSGVFTLEDCYNLDCLRKFAEENSENPEFMQNLLIPTDKLYSAYPKARLDEEQTRLFKNGVTLSADRIDFDKVCDSLYTVYNYESALVALAKIDENNALKIIQRFQV